MVILNLIIEIYTDMEAIIILEMINSFTHLVKKTTITQKIVMEVVNKHNCQPRI